MTTSLLLKCQGDWHIRYIVQSLLQATSWMQPCGSWYVCLLMSFVYYVCTCFVFCVLVTESCLCACPSKHIYNAMSNGRLAVHLPVHKSWIHVPINQSKTANKGNFTRTGRQQVPCGGRCVITLLRRTQCTSAHTCGLFHKHTTHI